MFRLLLISYRRIFLTTLFIFSAQSVITGKSAKEPFYPAGIYEPDLLSPEAFLGFSAGERPVGYHEALDYFKNLSEKSTRVKFHEIGQSYENRRLYYAVITSVENHIDLDRIKKSIGQLANPTTLNELTATSLIEYTPAVVWMGYSIHGNELSSTDAALQVAYQLAAGLDSLSVKIRNELVVCIIPLINPDGRERTLAQIQQWSGLVPNSDVQSLQHTGMWPGGRGNHYLFDLNRDWFILNHPETRACARAVLEWNPQLVIDSHEMGPFSTYLFSPPAEPLNPNISQSIKKWWDIFAADQAKAFDSYGWSYYTHAWNDEWYPGYGASWPLYFDAVGILYEQARTNGSLVKRPGNTILTFREAIHHHFVSSMANLTTALKHRQELLTDFYRAKLNSQKSPGKGAPRYFYIPVNPENPSRSAHLIKKLLYQNIQIYTTEQKFKARMLHDYWGKIYRRKVLPEGTYVIPLRQSMGRLAKTILEFDPHIISDFLAEERESIEKHQGSKIYDVTAWALPMAYHVECYWSDQKPVIKMRLIENIPEERGEVNNPAPTFGFLLHTTDDRSMFALAKLLEKKLNVRVASKPFETADQSYPRGTILLRKNENPSTLSADLLEIARQNRIQIEGVNTALCKKGPDLGDDDFILLKPPQIALIAGHHSSVYSFSELWYLLDYGLQVRTSLLHEQRIAGSDLQKYNIIILPSVHNPHHYSEVLGKGGIHQLKNWIENGGTLIAIGSGAAFVADTTVGFSQVRLRRQALKQLKLFESAANTEAGWKKPQIDSLLLWEGESQPTLSLPPKEEKAPDLAWLTQQDEQLRRFMPRGAILKVNIDQTHWLGYGINTPVPAIVFTTDAFLSRPPVQTVARFAEANELRLSGLLWPEAKIRLSKAAYVTREHKGRGQIIIFADEPNFRGYFHATERFLLNALLFGPGMGTEHSVSW